MFGANILSTRDDLGEAGTYDDICESLGISVIRYPGGTLTERYFDLSNPNQDTAVDVTNGNEIPLLPYGEFMAYAEDADIAVNIVLPTTSYLSEETDANGHRFAQIDEAEVRGFIQSTLNGEFGAPDIRSFEIGNEYWGVGMSSLEYGRVAARMSEIIDEELNSHPNAILFTETDVIVQMGTNYGTAGLDGDYAHLTNVEDQIAALNEDYGLALDDSHVSNSGQIVWARVANEIIIGEFDTSSEQMAIDGVVSHIYSRGPEIPNSRYFDLATVESTWEKAIPDLERHVTEWNVSSRSAAFERGEDFGLLQAHEILNVAEAMNLFDVEAAYVWPVQQNNNTTLSGDEGDLDLRVPGEMFRMMKQNLTDTRPVDLTGGAGRETEEQTPDADIHMFQGQDRIVFYVASTTGEQAETMIDLSGIVTDPGQVTATRLGVAPGEAPGDGASQAAVTGLSQDAVLQDGVLMADLNAYEILEVVLEAPTLTDNYSGFLEANGFFDQPPEEMAADLAPEMTMTALMDNEAPALFNQTDATVDAPTPATFAPAVAQDSPEEDGTDAFLATVMLAPSDKAPDTEDTSDEGDDESSGDDGGFGGMIGALLLLPLLMLG
ncbi:hypothetical protein [Thalassovita taeanensis]|uniref:Alpha-L-arabinofuranosidase n=1 Tax=Thalassovita taeanensis TaxID=657014 RepID=A0A1H9HSA0_9RHOB|nr:hypothetical protein [Thalassovita taeanensis]SEQ65254.1 hypothetical protein SAMN04488092_11066 [Thalassovita taeanensis]